MTVNKKKTSSKVTSQAAKILGDKNSSKTAKSLAASALAQSGNKKQTGEEMEDLASTVLNSDKFNSKTKSLAGSVLSPSNKKRYLFELTTGLNTQDSLESTYRVNSLLFSILSLFYELSPHPYKYTTLDF